MFRSKPSILILTAVCFVTMLSACDPDEGVVDDHLADSAAGADDLYQSELEAQQPFEASSEAVAATIASQSTTQACHPLAGTIEKFYFSSTEDTIATTSATGGLIAPFPAGIPTFDEPEIDTGLLIAVKIYDEDHNLVGFGTEQEVVDNENAGAETTFTITLPGRGTLMLKQVEDFTPFFDEINDMIADQEFIRVFDPPLVHMTTVHHTGEVVGGTGEFAGAKGRMQEIDTVYGIDLINQELDVADLIQVKFK